MAACGVGWQAANDNDNVFGWAPEKGLRIVAHRFPAELDPGEGRRAARRDERLNRMYLETMRNGAKQERETAGKEIRTHNTTQHKHGIKG